MEILEMELVGKKAHLIGIGGISMSAIAQLLHKEDWEVTGSDMARSMQTEILEENGIKVTIGHNVEDVLNADIVIYNSAIPKTDIEYVAAKEAGKMMYERAVFLGILGSQYEESIAISGTHGKTTTTSMVSCIFLEAQKDPSIQVGAFLSTIKSNYRIGGSKYFIYEACEYKDSFLNFYPTTAVITNIDEDHLDYFKTLDGIMESFQKYSHNIKDRIILNLDDINSARLYKYINQEKPELKVVTFGENIGDYRYKNIEYNKKIGNGEYKLSFVPVMVKNGEKIEMPRVYLNVSGKHNILNALAAIIVAKEYGISERDIVEGLKSYKGASRRFEYKGNVNGAEIYDDYAHHPTEIKALAEGIKHLPKNNVIAIFEAHTYTRVLNHKQEFIDVLKEFDKIVVTEIYAAREINETGITGQVIAEGLLEQGKEAVYLEKEEEIVDYVKKNAQKGDIVVTIGAGVVTKYGPLIAEKNKM